MKKLFTRRKRKAARAERPVVYSLPRDVAAIQEFASTIGGMFVIKEHWPDSLVTKRAAYTLPARKGC
jgi:hypothetical protein